MKEIKHEFLVDYLDVPLICIPCGDMRKCILKVMVIDVDTFQVIKVIKQSSKSGWNSSVDKEVPIWDKDVFYLIENDDELIGLLL